MEIKGLDKLKELDVTKVKDWIKTKLHKPTATNLQQVKGINLSKAMDWFKARFQKTSSLIGVDVGTASIKFLELSQIGDSYQVENYAITPLPLGAVIEQDIKEPANVTKAIHESLIKTSFKTRNAAISVPDSSVITKIIQLDATLRSGDIESQILLEADKHIPYPVEEVSLDFQVLGVNPKNHEWVDVLLVASHKDNVDARVAAIAEGGVHPMVVDVESYAIERVGAVLLKQLPGQGLGQTVAIVDIGANVLTLTVLHDRETIFTRSEIFGGMQLTRTVEQRYSLSYPDAELAKQQGKLPDDYTTEILEPFKEAVILQIRRALQFFFSTSQHAEIQFIILAGGTALIPGITTLVTERMGTNTTLANPFAQMSVANKIDAAELKKIAPCFVLSCGLALRGFG